MANMQIVPAYRQNVEAQHVEMMVPLYSYGCERKMEKALSHLKGIYSVSVNHSQQKVTVWGICNKYDVLEATRRKRRGACFWNPEDNIGVIAVLQDEDPSQVKAPDFPAEALPRDSKASILLTKARSFNMARSLQWKAFRKVFTRSDSF